MFIKCMYVCTYMSTFHCYCNPELCNDNEKFPHLQNRFMYIEGNLKRWLNMQGKNKVLLNNYSYGHYNLHLSILIH
jgi:hypothetical protein